MFLKISSLSHKDFVESYENFGEDLVFSPKQFRGDLIMKRCMFIIGCLTILLMLSTGSWAQDVLRLKNVLGQPGLVWEWDHNTPAWAFYVSSDTKVTATNVAIGPCLTLGYWSTCLYGGATLDQARKHLPVQKLFVDNFNLFSFCKDPGGKNPRLLVRLDQILGLDHSADNALFLTGWANIVYRVKNAWLGLQGINYLDKEVKKVYLGPRWEYLFLPKIKMVHFLGVRATAPYDKFVFWELWYTL